MGTYVRAAAQDSDRLAADRGWVRWGMAAAATGMLAWVIAVALIPLDAKLDKGEQHLVQVLRAHTGQLYAAALLAVLGAGSYRSPQSYGSSPWPPRYRDRSGRPPLPPSEPAGDQDRVLRPLPCAYPRGEPLLRNGFCDRVRSVAAL